MPGTNFESDDPDFDAQDQAETFDETNLTEGADTGEVRSYREANERRTFDELPDVEDMTRAEGDDDEDEALALDASEFDPQAVDDGDFEEDDELDYHAADAAREDDIDGQGPEDGFAEDGFAEDRVSATEIEGLDEVRDADEAEGGEDDVTNFQSTEVSDDDLRNMGYANRRERP